MVEEVAVVVLVGCFRYVCISYCSNRTVIGFVVVEIEGAQLIVVGVAVVVVVLLMEDEEALVLLVVAYLRMYVVVTLVLVMVFAVVVRSCSGSKSTRSGRRSSSRGIGML